MWLLNWWHRTRIVLLFVMVMLIDWASANFYLMLHWIMRIMMHLIEIRRIQHRTGRCCVRSASPFLPNICVTHKIIFIGPFSNIIWGILPFLMHFWHLIRTIKTSKVFVALMLTVWITLIITIAIMIYCWMETNNILLSHVLSMKKN